MKCIICNNEIKENNICKVCGWKVSSLIDSNILLSHLTKEEIKEYQESIKLQQEVYLTREILNEKLNELIGNIAELKENNLTLTNKVNLLENHLLEIQNKGIKIDFNTIDHSEKTQAIPVIKKLLDIKSIGQIVEFGRYYKNNNTELEPIEWKVLDIQDNRALLITKDIIDCVPFNEVSKNITWEDCTLRNQWVPSFINTAFNYEEKNQIIPQGNDSVFMLSVEETRKYFKDDEDRKAQGTRYAKLKHLWVSSGNGNSWWWLRTKGSSTSCATVVSHNGHVSTDGYNVAGVDYGVLPALWVQI